MGLAGIGCVKPLVGAELAISVVLQILTSEFVQSINQLVDV